MNRFGYGQRRATNVRRLSVLPFETRETQLQYRKTGTTEWFIAEGIARNSPDTNRIVHTVNLSGLDADASYDFQLPASNPAALYLTWKDNPSTTTVVHWHTLTPFPSWGYMTGFSSNTRKFKTMPNTLAEPLKIVQISDTHGRAGNYEMFENVALFNPDVIVHSGDMATGNGGELSPESWYLFFDAMLQMVDSEGFMIPILPNLGNHEVWGGQSGIHYGTTSGVKPNFETHERGDAEWYYSFFPSLIQQDYIVHDIAGVVSIWQLNPGITEYVDKGQDVWLGDTLQERIDVPHKLLSYHYSPYPVGRRQIEHYNNIPKTVWNPIFEPYKPLVMVGHDHVWSKTVPIKANAEHPDGVVYIGSGSAGERAREGRNPSTKWWIERSKASSWERFPFEEDPTSLEYREPHEDDGKVFDGREVNHFWLIEVQSDKRIITAYDMNKDVIYSFTQLV